MTDFWASMDIMGKVLFCTALASTTVLIIQIILLLIGFASGSLGDVDGVDTDTNGDGNFDADDAGGAGVGWFTIKGVIAFFAVGSWVGLGMDLGKCHPALTICVAVVVGFATLIGVGYLYKALYKLQSSGNVKLENAIGKTAEVYLTIPAKGDHTGKINVTIQERLIEAEARTMGDTAIHTGTLVKVVDIINGVLIVEPYVK